MIVTHDPDVAVLAKRVVIRLGVGDDHDGSSSSASSCPAPSRSSRRTSQPLDRELLGLRFGGHEAEAVEDGRRSLLDVVELGEDDQRLGLDRAADEYRVARARRPSSAGAAAAAETSEGRLSTSPMAPSWS